MELYFVKHLIVVNVSSYFIYYLAGENCEKQIFGTKSIRICPGSKDPVSYEFCCGPSWGRLVEDKAEI